MSIPYLPLQAINRPHLAEISEAVRGVIESGWYLRGTATRQFEHAYARYIGTRHCVACASGLDALRLILRGYMETGKLKEGDEVLVPANTYIATILAITDSRLTPVLVEPSIDTLQIDPQRIEEAITPRARALIIVHLYGRLAWTPAVGEIAERHGLLLIEDNAQAHGLLTPDGRRTGSLGHAAAHSFYPGKNLGAMGDAGAVTTDDDELALAVSALANYGSQEKYVFRYRGMNSRMDEVQAAILTVKLRYLDEENKKRQALARRYLSEIRNPHLQLPRCAAEDSVWHIFPILSPRRDDLQRHLREQGVETIIHYPIPPHRQQCYAQWRSLSLPVTERIHREELSIPCHPALTGEEQEQIIRTLCGYRPQ